MTGPSVAASRAPLIVLLLAGLLQACTPPPASSSDSLVLRETIADLNIEDPTSDLARNLNAGDTRFIGIAGFSCHAPGVEDGEADLVRAHGMNCLAGTSDVIESRSHLKLIGEATEYAQRYNRALVLRLRGMAAP